MKRRIPESVHMAEGQGLSLSGAALTELMQAVLRKKVPFRFRAGGFSMAPFIKDGDLLTLYPLAALSLRIGDVVAFSHPVSGRLTVHRIVAEEKSFYRLKGDGADAADGAVPQEKMIGIVRRVERDGRDIFFGLGPERRLIARLSDEGLLTRALPRLQRLYQILRRFG